MPIKSSSTSLALDLWQSESDGTPAGRSRSFGSPAIWTLVAMICVLIGVTPFVEVDRIVDSTSGKIVATEAVNRLQTLDPSIINTIDVKEGEQVAAGQLLATLDPTFAAADVGQLRQQIDGLDAQILRAKAEQANIPLVFPARLSAQNGPYVALQKQLFDQRAAQLVAQTRSFDEKIKTTLATIAKTEADQEHLEDREKISHAIEDMRDTLYKSGATSLLNVLAANDTRLETQRMLENDKNSLTELHHQLSALEADRDASIQTWYSTSSQELVDAQNLRDTAEASLEKATKHEDLVRFTAKEPSVVLTLTKLSSGSVLKDGDELMTLMPLRALVQAEIHFSAKDIGFVRPGNHVTIKVDAFSYFEHGTAEGRLDWISEGAFTTDDDGKPVSPYYKARISIQQTNFINVPQSFRLIPGMTLAADINTGRRSLFKYAAGGLFRGLGEAAREP